MLAISVSGRKHIPNLIYSVPCSPGVAGCAKDGSGRRGWEIATNGVEALQNVVDARSLSFLDIDEDVSDIHCLCRVILTLNKGTLDILVQRSGDAGEGHYLFVHNNFYYDAFFLKAIGKYCLFSLIFQADEWQFSMVPATTAGAMVQMDLKNTTYVTFNCCLLKIRV